MSAMFTIRNDGPDDLVLVFGDPSKPASENTPCAVIRAGQERRVSTSQPVRFTAQRQPTLRELAEANGVSYEEYQKHQPYKGPTRYADPE